jgi:periplasmic protein TonB
MYGSLAIHRGPAFRASRGTALLAIGVLHVGLLALALQQRINSVAPEPAIISISLLSAERPRVSQMMTHALVPRLDAPAQVVLLPPELAWEASEEPSATTLAAAIQPATPSASQMAQTRSGSPLQISQAQYLRAPVLRYPPAALSARREGSVGLRVLVGEDGRVIEVVVERPSGYAPFDEAACNAVRAALFKPYTVNGEPRVVLVRIPIDFTLQRRGA